MEYNNFSAIVYNDDPKRVKILQKSLKDIGMEVFKGTYSIYDVLECISEIENKGKIPFVLIGANSAWNDYGEDLVQAILEEKELKGKGILFPDGFDQEEQLEIWKSILKSEDHKGWHIVDDGKNLGDLEEICREFDRDSDNIEFRNI